MLLTLPGHWKDTSSLDEFQVFDERKYTKWSSAKGNALNNVFDIELQTPCRISDILVDNEFAVGSPFPGLQAKTVRVFASTSSPTSGYDQIAEAVVNKASTKRITIDPQNASGPYKWLRFVVVDNWGEKDATELYEIQAFGERVDQDAGNAAPTIKGGTYGGTWGAMKLVADGNALFGCRCDSKANSEDMLGSVQGNQARVFFPFAGHPGVAILTQSASGEFVNISCYYKYSPNATTSNLFAFQKSEKSLSCNREPIRNIETLISKYLEQDQKAILFGIDFKPDSAELRSESDATLNAIATLMKKQPALRLSVEAHNGWTDTNPIKNVALDHHDDSIQSHIELSDARAKAVVDWLCNHQVDRSRLQAKGWGKEKPIFIDGIETPLQSLILNRRIELIPLPRTK